MTKSDFFKANIEAFNIFRDNEIMLTVDQCAIFLNLHPNTIKKHIDKKYIVAVFQSGKYHIPKIQFLDRLTENLSYNSEIKSLIKDNVKALTVFNANATIFTIDQCAKYLNVHPRTIKNRIKTNTIESILRQDKYYIAKLQFLSCLTYEYENDIQEAS